MVLSTIPAQAIAVDNMTDASEAEFQWTDCPESVTLKPGGTADKDLEYNLQVPSEVVKALEEATDSEQKGVSFQLKLPEGLTLPVGMDAVEVSADGKSLVYRDENEAEQTLATLEVSEGYSIKIIPVKPTDQQTGSETADPETTSTEVTESETAEEGQQTRAISQTGPALDFLVIITKDKQAPSPEEPGTGENGNGGTDGSGGANAPGDNSGTGSGANTPGDNTNADSNTNKPDDNTGAGGGTNASGDKPGAGGGTSASGDTSNPSADADTSGGAASDTNTAAAGDSANDAGNTGTDTGASGDVILADRAGAARSITGMDGGTDSGAGIDAPDNNANDDGNENTNTDASGGGEDNNSNDNSNAPDNAGAPNDTDNTENGGGDSDNSNDSDVSTADEPAEITITIPSGVLKADENFQESEITLTAKVGNDEEKAETTAKLEDPVAPQNALGTIDKSIGLQKTIFWVDNNNEAENRLSAEKMAKEAGKDFTFTVDGQTWSLNEANMKYIGLEKLPEAAVVEDGTNAYTLTYPANASLSC